MHSETQTQEISVIDSLAKIELFKGIDRQGLEQIAGLCVRIPFKKNDVFFEEGDLGDKLYLILDGQVRISRNVQGMGEEALAVLGAGAAFGEMALVEDAPRSADAKGHQAGSMLVLNKDDLEQLLFADKDLAYEVLWNVIKILSHRLRQTNDKMTFLSVTGKFE